HSSGSWVTLGGGGPGAIPAAWSAITSYQPGSYVIYNGGTYVCLVFTYGAAPGTDPSTWASLATLVSTLTDPGSAPSTTPDISGAPQEPPSPPTEPEEPAEWSVDLKLQMATSDNLLWETAPVDTHVADLIVAHHETDEISFSLTGSGASSRDNGLFDLSGPHLHLMAPIERNPQDPYLRIRVKAENQEGQAMEKDFALYVQAVNVPIVRTEELEDVDVVSRKKRRPMRGPKASATVLADGGSPIIEVGFLLSKNFSFGYHDPNVKKYVGQLWEGAFTQRLYGLDSGVTYYCRAYARNEQGLAFGAPKRLKTVLENKGTALHGLALGNGWEEIHWLGMVFHAANGWYNHQDLGWFYAVLDNSDGDGVWLWSASQGWMWTDPQIYPYLWTNRTQSWRYFNALGNGKSLLFDYGSRQWSVFHLFNTP
ncbi:MAG: hypothetical protein VB980_04930, partial [Opitutales bacterium]